jgi:tetratricopeptide (TPR) repeat protein
MQKHQAAIALILLLLQCTAAAAPAPQKQSAAAKELVQYKAKVMSADYRADLPELERLRDELAKWPEDKELAWLARYWGGFASWRIAINGFNRNMSEADQTTHMRRAAADFYNAIRLKQDCADAYAATALINAMFAQYLYKANDHLASRERIYLAYTHLDRAMALEPRNPRVLWAKAAFTLYRPPQTPENASRAIVVYKEMLAEAQRQGVDPNSPLPDWGEAEARMSMAWAQTMTAPPDLAAARKEAQAALAAVPEWSYVRDTLIPQIEQRLRDGR